MGNKVFINRSHPQTLYIACFLLYFNLIIAAIFLLGGAGAANLRIDNVEGDILRNTAALALTLFFPALSFLAAFGIANEKKPAWYLGITIPSLGLVSSFVLDGPSFLVNNPIGVMIDVALVALLLHDESRKYIRIWFK